MIPTSDIEDAEVQETGETSVELEKPPVSKESAKACFPLPKPRMPSQLTLKKNPVKRPPKSNLRKDSGSVAKPSSRPPKSATPEAAVNVSGPAHRFRQRSFFYPERF
jgi:hypothetical protein